MFKLFFLIASLLAFTSVGAADCSYRNNGDYADDWCTSKLNLTKPIDIPPGTSVVEFSKDIIVESSTQTVRICFLDVQETSLKTRGWKPGDVFEVTNIWKSSDDLRRPSTILMVIPPEDESKRFYLSCFSQPEKGLRSALNDAELAKVVGGAATIELSK